MGCRQVAGAHPAHEVLGRLVAEVVPRDDEDPAVAPGGIDVGSPGTDRDDEHLGICQELSGKPQRCVGDRLGTCLSRRARIEDDLDGRYHPRADAVAEQGQSLARLQVLRDGDHRSRCELEPQHRDGKPHEQRRRTGEHHDRSGHDRLREQ